MNIIIYSIELIQSNNFICFRMNLNLKLKSPLNIIYWTFMRSLQKTYI